MLKRLLDLPGKLRDGTVDSETRKRLYLLIGKRHSDAEADHFAKGRELIDAWFAALGDAVKYASGRIPTRKGPRTHPELIDLVHELADIYVRETDNEFQ